MQTDANVGRAMSSKCVPSTYGHRGCRSVLPVSPWAVPAAKDRRRGKSTPNRHNDAHNRSLRGRLRESGPCAVRHRTDYYLRPMDQCSRNVRRPWRERKPR